MALDDAGNYYFFGISRKKWSSSDKTSVNKTGINGLIFPDAKCDKEGVDVSFWGKKN